jgi:stearoyl-CoA desaturase (delta-9 desaturase)
VALLSFLLRGLCITGFYHCYFAHRAYKTSRYAQFMFALIGVSAMQTGPLGWAAQHRNHHRKSEQPEDVHPPIQYGFCESHVGWMLRKRNAELISQVRDLAKYPELVMIDRLLLAPAFVLTILLYSGGEWLRRHIPGSGTSGAQMVIWAFSIATVALWNVTWSVNSVCHIFGSKRFATGDESRNNWLIAVPALGEGWHNNHHFYPGSARQGFYWWEVDLTYYFLLLLERLGLIWDLRAVPVSVYETAANPPQKVLQVASAEE